MSIIVKNALVEAHHFIGIVEHYHRPLEQVHSIITTKIPGIKPNLVFQMYFKAIINSVCFNGLIFILQIFDTYFKRTKLDVLFQSITQYTIAIKKTIDKV